MAIVHAPPLFHVQRSKERAFFNHGWLQTYHSFSFAEYFDPSNEHWGALRVFNDDVVAGGEGFPEHPHRDMEILTYVLEGRLSHRDSMGNHGVVGVGGVQFMSAGTGVRHSEYNDDPQNKLRIVQMWVLPGKRGEKPSYGQMDFAPEARLNTWLRVASGEAEVEAPIRLTQAATFCVATVENDLPVYTFAPNRFGFIFVASGQADINGEKFDAGDSVRLYDVERLAVKGRAELVLWDLPSLPE
jgi:redox-sensitive bicupin YhaK (pirin superfamily)